MLAWLATGALLACALWRMALGYPKPRRRTRWLSRAEVAFLSGAAEATFPPGGAIATSGIDADLPSYTDRFLSVSPPRMRLLMRVLFLLVEHATLFFPAPGRGGMRRFSSLSAEQRGAVLEGWRTSRLFSRRLVFSSLRAVLTMGYVAHPTVARALGVAPVALKTPVCEVDLIYPPIGRPPQAIAFTRADLTPPSDGTPIPPGTPLHPAYAERPR